MFQLAATSHFKRKYKKLIKRNKPLEERFDICLGLMTENPWHNKLSSHKVVARDAKPAYSSRVMSDIRIIWRFGENDFDFEPEVIDLVDVGGHEGGKRVYK